MYFCTMFFKKINKFFFYILAVGFLSTSCSHYQIVLKGDDAVAKYRAADSLYQVATTTGKKGKYKKTLKLMEQIVPVYRGKPQAEKLTYMYANTFYNLEDFVLSGYQFERFEASYPKSDSVELAAYKSAKSYYELSPRYSLDQEDTRKGLDKLQAFVNKYPDSQYREESNALVKELREKLEKKDIKIADQYLKIGQQMGSFKPAMDAYENFISDHPGSVYREQAFYGRFLASYNRATSSLPSAVQERLINAKEFYSKYLKYYKTGELKVAADLILLDIDARLSGYDEITSEN
jgi:outer membrane protein assembly factor BamD